MIEFKKLHKSFLKCKLTAPLLSYKNFEESFFKLSTTSPSFPASPANAYPR